MIKIIKKIIEEVKNIIEGEYRSLIINGINRIISTSKIKKITAKRKNRIEKGERVYHVGSNPHSNGEFFSRDLYVLN